MINAMKIPADINEPTTVVELDDEKEHNPYFLAKQIIGDWVERVKIDPEERLFMFVDESGQLKQLPRNQRAGLFYGGPTGIAGDVLIMCLKEEWTDDGPDYVAQDVSQEDMRRIVMALNRLQ